MGDPYIPSLPQPLPPSILVETQLIHIDPALIHSLLTALVIDQQVFWKHIYWGTFPSWSATWMPPLKVRPKSHFLFCKWHLINMAIERFRRFWTAGMCLIGQISLQWSVRECFVHVQSFCHQRAGAAKSPVQILHHAVMIYSMASRQAKPHPTLSTAQKLWQYWPTIKIAHEYY